MARRGDELINAVTGLRTVFRTTARESGGELLQVDWIGEPHWTTGPDHVHRLQEERFEVLSGRLGLRVDGVERVHGPGVTDTYATRWRSVRGIPLVWTGPGHRERILVGAATLTTTQSSGRSIFDQAEERAPGIRKTIDIALHD